MSATPTFPAPIYAESVLSVNFADAQRLFLDALLEIHYAHTLMLAKRSIISLSDASECLKALDSLDRHAIRACNYDRRFEDLFFYIESQIGLLCGAENAGRMHTARSRNDIDLTLYRMCLRREVLAVADTVTQVSAKLLSIAEKHTGTLMPAYTHTQPAQPTTLAHYFLAAIECFDRDALRLQAVFATINRNPLGACAITTTGFPIDRYLTAELLGFEGLQLNSYGAIAASDYVTETAGVIATVMVNLGRFVQDLLLWCNPEVRFLRLSDAWVQISSIMPQNRNPVALEHTRILASKALAQAQGVLTAVHNTPFGDIVDCEDDLQPLVFSMTSDAARALRLFAGLMSDCQIDTERLAARAHDDFLTVTELADTLTRDEGIGFRQAHKIVSEAVKEIAGRYSPAAMAKAASEAAHRILGRPLQTSQATMLKALDPANFIALRQVPGGPALEAIRPALADAAKAGALSQTWLQSKTSLLDSCPDRVAQLRTSLFSKLV